ncbi:PH domain-containing protein [Nocardioides sp. R-C-SC26]|uniref:PH domain-containing protein n=1 Tax=Nocardioides sp. R-C-SC26 TaxID=2870414 RepID=UPI001E5BE92D|nr:PH domain-containing protein [Nocardioides sp. R-C-SC26]
MTQPQIAPGAPGAGRGGGAWERLDRRMLLVHPVRELGKFLPLLIGLVVAGTASGTWWQVGGVAIPIVLGVVRYLTTSYRIDAATVELKRGLLERRTVSIPRDRIRAVDLTASPVHRILRLTAVRIGTGLAQSGDDDELELDALDAVGARALREQLLRTPGRPLATPAPDLDGVLPTAARPAAPDVVAAFSPAWLRFAPFTAAGVVVAAALVGGLAQLAEMLNLYDDVERTDVSLTLSPSLLITLLALGGAVVLLVASVLGYLVTNGNFLLTREPDSWRVRRGLLTTRETTVDGERVAGISLGESWALRVAGGRSLRAIVTGVDRSDSSSATLVPAAPATDVEHAARRVAGDSAPVDAPLRRHGAAAERRRWIRALGITAVILGAALVALAASDVAVAGSPAWWWTAALGVPAVAIAAALAFDRARGLGSASIGGRLVVRSGSLTRRREVLRDRHVIGWTMRSTYFQRRAGLVTLCATTAGGNGRVVALDVPRAAALALADETTPGLLDAFTA